MSAIECLPISKPVRTAEPTQAQEPVTLAEAKHQCGLADAVNVHDQFLYSAIAAAREQVENDTGLVCYTGTFTQKFTDWPTGEFFELADLRPVTSITSIAYLDTDGTSQTLATSVYQLETAAVKQFVRLKYNQLWPSLRGDINGVTVTYVAGYASVAVIPKSVKQAVLLKLHCEWLLKNEMDAGKQEDGYERVVNRLGRRTYP